MGNYGHEFIAYDHNTKRSAVLFISYSATSSFEYEKSKGIGQVRIVQQNGRGEYDHIGPVCSYREWLKGESEDAKKVWRALRGEK